MPAPIYKSTMVQHAYDALTQQLAGFTMDADLANCTKGLIISSHMGDSPTPAALVKNMRSNPSANHAVA